MRQENAASWSDIPTSALRAELLRRQTADHDRPTCGRAGATSDYNMPLHVFALVLILVLSTLACSFPILVRRLPRMPVPRQFLFLSRHFGTGVLIATAFVHLLPTAFNSLTDPCLPPFWNHGYPAMAGFIAMISVMVVVAVEMFFASKGAGHSHSSEYLTPGGQHEDMVPLRSSNRQGLSRPLHQRSDSYRPFSQGQIGADENNTESTVSQNASPWQDDGSYNDSEPLAQKGRSSLDDTGSNSDLDLDELEVVNVFVSRATIHGTGALLVKDQRVVLNTDALQNDCGCAHSRCYAVQFFAIGAEMYDEARPIQDYRT